MPVRHGCAMKHKRSRIQAVKMSYLRGACGIIRLDGESNEEVYEGFNMKSKGGGI